MTAQQSGAIKTTTQGSIDWPASDRNAGRNEIGTGGRLRFGISGRLQRNAQQANGVIWIEGPSDRIYLRRWIELLTDGQIKEGVHYSMMFYGGRLLAHLESTPPDEESELISILSLNRNAAMIIDSDRHKGREASPGKKARQPRMHINDTKKRIQAEVERMKGFVWITAGREIENYAPNAVFERIVGAGKFEVDAFEDLPEHSYLKRFNKNKIELVHAVAEAMTIDDIRGHLDLDKRAAELIGHIKGWN